MKSDNEAVKNSMDFLCNKKIEEFRSSILNDIRNKGAFHADPEIVTSFFDNSDILDDDEILIWTENDDGSNNYPIANDILAAWFVVVLNSNDLAANIIYLREIYFNLRNVVHFLMFTWFKVKLITS